MYRAANDAYLENRVLSASPLDLVRILYQAALSAVRDARRSVSTGDIASRARSISKACAILMELTNSLDAKRGGEIARRLTALYEYMHSRLLDANMRQDEEPLAEVLGLMATLAEAWDGIGQQAQPSTPAATPWSHAPTPAPDFANSARTWSF